MVQGPPDRSHETEHQRRYHERHGVRTFWTPREGMKLPVQINVSGLVGGGDSSGVQASGGCGT
tara:strand:- start:385 stop:573 length:189 start_codon:yes stop_codon:yes gene_type:complete